MYTTCHVNVPSKCRLTVDDRKIFHQDLLADLRLQHAEQVCREAFDLRTMRQRDVTTTAAAQDLQGKAEMYGDMWS